MYLCDIACFDHTSCLISELYVYIKENVLSPAHKASSEANGNVEAVNVSCLAI